MSYQPEERYWTDYLRVALPVVGLLLMLGLFLFWANQLINPDDTPPTEVAVIVENPEGTEVISAASPVPTATPAQNLATADPGAESTTPPQENAPAPTPTTAPTPEATEADGETAEETEVEFAIDDLVEVTEDGVNLRSSATTEEDNIVTTLNSGDLVTIIGGPEESEQYTWYEVSSDEDGLTGWVVARFLQPTT